MWKPPLVDGWDILTRDDELAQAPGAEYAGLLYYYFNPRTQASSWEPPVGA